MSNSIKRQIPFLVLILLIFGLGNSFAQNKTVVIPLGSSGTQYEILAAHIDADGSIIQSTKGVTSSHLDTGLYRITFPRPITACYITGAARTPSSGLLALDLVVTFRVPDPDTLDPKDLKVHAFRADQVSFRDHGINVVVYCP